MSKYTPWDLSALSESDRATVTEALDRTDFNFGSLVPGLEAQVRRNTIPVLFSDLSRMRQHGNDLPFHLIEREIEGRKRTLGLAWYIGKVEVERSIPRELQMEVFLAEGAHMVDFFYMTPEHREKIFDIYHDGDARPHDHGWFEETGNDNYWSWVGESFMYGFIAAFSNIPYTSDRFHHQTTAEIGKQIKLVFNPERPVVKHQNSYIVHRAGSWHERQIRNDMQEYFFTVDEAIAAGYRKCKTCRWLGL